VIDGVFRDRPPCCPRCEAPLVRDEGRDRWRCSSCRGELVSVGEVAAELLAVDPALAAAGAVRDVATMGRGRAAILPCAVCGADMEPGFLGGVEIDRCRAHGVFWFDRDELEAVLAKAEAQREERVASAARRLLGKD
jgi:Zn-finger nucleic acid-binding protein